MTGRSKNIFSKGKWEAEDMLVDHESGTDNWLTKSKTDDENRTSMIARNPCEDGLNYKQRRYTAVSDMKL